ncbi:hypothetical protein JXB11_00540 [Candidatus Woesearchaeota archaeon]|nr:hypothetical protein [Candidatus Woesearchaeota archaeon]
MPHQCVRCNTFYEDGAAEILKGCPCGGKLFFFIKKEKLEKAKEVTVNLTPKEKQQIEFDVLDIIGEEAADDQPVVLDMEAIRILKPGKYELDLVHLFKKDPLVYKVGEGKYLIDIIRSFSPSKKL